MSISLTTVQLCAQYKPRTWRRATIDQRNQIADRYERTGDLNYAFKGVKFSKVQLSDLVFDTVGARRMK